MSAWAFPVLIIGWVAFHALDDHWTRQDALEKDRTTLHLARAKCGTDDQ